MSPGVDRAWTRGAESARDILCFSLCDSLVTLRGERDGLCIVSNPSIFHAEILHPPVCIIIFEFVSGLNFTHVA